MTRKIKKDKKGVSEVVSYVMLIAIVIGLSVLVYAFLKVQIPKAEKTCEEGISVIIRNIQCDNVNNRVIIEFQNKGLFRVDGVYIRFANNSKDAPTLFLNATGNVTSISSKRTLSEGFFYFGRKDPPLPLSPNRNYIQNFSYSTLDNVYNASKVQKVQIQPFINDDETQEAIICEDKSVTKEINCS